MARLGEAGLPAPSLRLERLEWGILEIRDLRAADEVLSVARLEVRFGAWALLSGRVEELRARDVELRGEAADALPVLDALWTLLGPGTEAELGPRWDRLAVETARFALETPLGGLEATGSGRVARLRDAGVEGELRLEAKRGPMRGQVVLRGRAAPEELYGQLDLELLGSGSFASGSLESGSLNLDAELRGRPEEAELVLRDCADLRISGLLWRDVLALVSPLRACLGAPEQAILRLGRSPAGERRLEGALEVPPARFDLELGSERTRAEGETPRISLALAGSPEHPTLQLDSRRGYLRASEPALEVRDLDGSLQWSPGSGLRGRLGLDLSETLRLPRLGLALELSPEAGGTSFRAFLGDDARRLALQLAGRAGGVGQPLRAELSLQPVSLGRDGVELLRLLPGLEDAEAMGTLAALGSLVWGKRGLSGSADVALRDVTFTSSRASVERANGVVRLEGPSPLSAPPGQLLSVARLDFGVELLDGLARFGLAPDGAFVIEPSAWTLAGGEAVARGSLEPEVADPLVLRVEDADVAALFALLDLPGIGGEGSLSGEIALARGEGGLLIESASFGSEGSGWIRYRPGPEQPDEVFAALAPRAEALANFRYDELRLELSGAVPGNVDVAVMLLGANPDLGELSPVELHFDVPGALEPRPGVPTREHAVPAEVSEQLSSFEDRLRRRVRATRLTRPPTASRG